MNISRLKPLSAALFASLFSLATYADTAPQSPDAFETACTNAWMQGSDAAKDKVDYKNFGEKYCGCAAKQPLNNDGEVQTAIQLCMSRTLLHDAMDSLEDEVGLKKATDTDISGYCQNRWALVLPNLNDAEKQKTMAYCECAKPKLADLIKQSDNMTDKQYDEGIDTVAADCSSNAVVSKPTASQ
jgi:hypothetical protein